MKRKIGKIQYTVRFVALEALVRIERGGAYSNLLLRELMNQGRLNDKDGRLLTEMVYGTISRQLLLDYYLANFIKNAKKVDPWVRSLLRLSLYQMLYLDKVPNHAILNEAVEIAKAKGNPGIGKFVNGVLRTIQREGVPALDQIKDPLERLAIEISMPLWLTERFVAQIGSDKTLELGLSLLVPSHASGRLDLQRITRNEAILQLQEEGIEARESQLSPYGIVADKGFLAGSSLYHAGLLTIQDESSMLVAPALHIAPEHQVLDACAAPGGKTTHIASFLSAEAGGKVTALDIHPHKVKLITENAERLAVSEVVQAEVMDAREVAQHFEEQQFDRILVDAPCSGLGLMRRKPDIKYNKQAADLERLPEIQLAILESAAPTLKNSGIMIYSTCTIMLEENQAVVEAFLADHPEFERIDVSVNADIAANINDQMLTIYPQDFMTDGFFISCLRKK
ncbi:16S rRNA (cytosine(967)-C(5))-methyltransferase RsmB [Enterococcus gallinarum]|uniref:16S rRNA (cytosine(967)-C(5))-methyltransferase n=1 Tax=Enterococcus gallinarum TaxID=1353 RepID=A0ABD4HLT0_ENTGA|nr:16S rRNA (cytosine(967)-C(5))-methyltransferase RsmB [Enterococcus gallinarum]MBA0947889.1 16S rRNA (cytosine(967)-C(5))-methyltransferase RsmB [Enterococcus gallinarum]MBA0960933.1 16S rRNA (cytosine(967)-C(5))-methyltransferase RsmB [Enterococcus gallinarum]MBA0968958.1 16S rRNA (cytosine(967)-C(5))-methyltransferase RsmB [Enterococcus gallinarum]MBA0972245.1 16S rRNA (cytosine(967)-C(5))-methyltransferase RsmB [Enterococcus gallinarum]NVI94861.1 16S rRNA (cytosine(967)-C(5))-methyltransf